jgi:hypothetical protein
MNLSLSVLGSTAVQRLTEAGAEHVLTIGSDRLTRGELSRVGCYNFVAAKNLSKILQAIGAKSLRAVFETIPPQALAVPHMGVVSLAVLGAAFEAKRIGGASPLEAYVRRWAPEGVKRAMVTFDTIKHREQAEVAKERKERKRRKAARRDQAHGVRVERFEAKAEKDAAS